MKRLALTVVTLATLAAAGCSQPAPAVAPTPATQITIDPKALAPTEGPYAGFVDPGQIYLQRLMEAEEQARQEKEKAAQAQARASSVDQMYWQWMEAARAGGWY